MELCLRIIVSSCIYAYLNGYNYMYIDMDKFFIKDKWTSFIDIKNDNILVVGVSPAKNPSTKPPLGITTWRRL